MKLDLSCPIELRGYSLNAEDGRICADVRLYNLTSRRIASFDGVAKWHSGASDKRIVCPFSAERLRTGGESGFRISLSTDRLPDADRLELLFSRVLFEDDGPDWRAGDGPFAELEPLSPISAAELEALRLTAGPDAVCFPTQDADTWTCVCGRINSLSQACCVRCHRSLQSVSGYTPEAVEQSAEVSVPEEISESEEAIVSEMHQLYGRQRSRLMRRTLLMAAAILALTVLLAVSAPGDASVVQVFAGILSAR